MKILTFFKKIPIVTLILIFINVFLFLLTDYIFGENLKIILESNPIGSEDFYIFQIITSSFIHFDLSHLLGNLLIFILFAPLVEHFLGCHKFILLILFSSVLNFFTYQVIVFKNKIESESLLKKNNISFDDIKYNKNFEIDFINSKIFDKVEKKSAMYISEMYISSKVNGRGFSVCVFSCLTIFLLIFNKKKPLRSLTALILIIMTTYLQFYGYKFSYSETLHLSGIIFGFIFFFIIKKGD
jgi:membrane associated rhomboid family serine protease